MAKQKLSAEHSIDLLTARVSAEKIKRREIKRVAKELRAEKTAEHKRLRKAKVPNRDYTMSINKTDRVKVKWLNGAQYVTVLYGDNSDSEPEEEVDDIKPVGPITTMTWNNLRAEVIGGSTVYNKQGKKIPCTKKAELTPDKKVKVTVETNGKSKVYRIV